MSGWGSAAAASWCDDEREDLECEAGDANLGGGAEDDDAGPAPIEVRAMEATAHRRLYLPVVRALPTAPQPRRLAPAHESFAFYQVESTSDAGRARATSVSMTRLSKHDLAVGQRMFPASVNDSFEDVRPYVRGDCLGEGRNGPRPCPWVSCKYHLALDVSETTGSIKINRPDLDVWGTTSNCALDHADRGGMDLESVGEAMNITRERVRQIEGRGLKKIRRAFLAAGVSVEALDTLIEREGRE